MVGEDGESAVGGAPVPPAPGGAVLPEGCDPRSKEGLRTWLNTLDGSVAADSGAWVDILEGEGITCLKDLVLNEDELIEIGMPRVTARRVRHGAIALFEREGWYMPRVVAEIPQVNASVAVAAPARARSGQINPLVDLPTPGPPARDKAGLMNRDDAVVSMYEVAQWAIGWAGTLSTPIRVMIENPELTVTEVLAHRLVMNEPLDRHENRLFASTLVSQWGILKDELVHDDVGKGNSGIHIFYELYNPSIKSVISEEVASYIDFLHPHKCDKLKCNDVLKLNKGLKKMAEVV